MSLSERIEAHTPVDVNGIGWAGHWELSLILAE